MGIAGKTVKRINRMLASRDVALVRPSRRAAEVTRPTPLEAALSGLLSARTSINIVQVGANDGKWGDPIHDFIMSERSATRLLLSEPQPEIAALLARTYASHPSVTIFPGAIAPQRGTLDLYRVRPALWDAVEMPYLRNAPSYRAPSGFASTSRDHVERHVREMRYRGSGATVRPQDAIEELSVPTETLAGLVEAHPDFARIDLLQVDVEGIDDVIVRSALNDGLRPSIINFEFMHLSPSGLRAITDLLSSTGYRTSLHGPDLMAIRRPSPTA